MFFGEQAVISASVAIQRSTARRATQLWHNDRPARGVRFTRRRRLNGWRPPLRTPKDPARSLTLFTS